MLFLGSFSSPRLLVSNWSTFEKITATITILTFPFSPRKESPSPSTKGRIQSSPPFPPRLRLFVSFLCHLQPASLCLLLLVLSLLLPAALTPPAPWSLPPLAPQAGAIQLCCSSVSAPGLCGCVWIHCTVVGGVECEFLPE